MELTTLDRELLDGLQVLTDQEIGRVQAHLAAGLPMRYSYGWTQEDRQGNEPACFGCIIGTAMGPATFREPTARTQALSSLALGGFHYWLAGHNWTDSSGKLPAAATDRLAALLDMEWSRRHPIVSQPQNLAESDRNCTRLTTPETGGLVSQPQLVGVGS